MLKAKIPVCFSLLITLGAFSCAPERQDQSQAQSQSFVTRGDMPNSKALISHTAVRISSRTLKGQTDNCSGSVIASDVVMTAAHCVTDWSPEGTRRALPVDNVKVENAFGSWWGRNVQVEKILITKEYSMVRNDEYDYGRDLALLKLKTPLPQDYRPVTIERDEAQVYQQNLLFAGFGDWVTEIHEEDSNAAGWLAVGKINLKDKVQLGNGNSRTPSNPGLAHRLAFKSSNSGPAACHGDSGGPIYYEKNGQIHQVGVIVGIVFDRQNDYNKYRCAIANSSEVSSSVFSINYEFIANGYQELTGRTLQ